MSGVLRNDLREFIRLRRRPRALPVDECITLGWIIHAPH
jgi:hypothetical protein